MKKRIQAVGDKLLVPSSHIKPISPLGQGGKACHGCCKPGAACQHFQTLENDVRVTSIGDKVSVETLPRNYFLIERIFGNRLTKKDQREVSEMIRESLSEPNSGIHKERLFERATPDKEIAYAPIRITRGLIDRWVRSYGDDVTRHQDAAPLLTLLVTSAFRAGLFPALKMSSDPLAAMMRLFRIGLTVEQLKPIKVGMTLHPFARMNPVQKKRTGELVEIVVELRDDKGEVVGRAVHHHFVKDATGGLAKESAKKPLSRTQLASFIPEGLTFQPDFRKVIRIPKALSRKYGNGPSRDRNLIHLDASYAKLAKLPGTLLQGSATMNLVQQMLYDNLLDSEMGGDPSRLAKMECKFTAPVYPGDKLAILASSQGHFAAFNQYGARVVEGTFGIARNRP